MKNAPRFMKTRTVIATFGVVLSGGGMLKPLVPFAVSGSSATRNGSRHRKMK